MTGTQSPDALKRPINQNALESPSPLIAPSSNPHSPLFVVPAALAVGKEPSLLEQPHVLRLVHRRRIEIAENARRKLRANVDRGRQRYETAGRRVEREEARDRVTEG